MPLAAFNSFFDVHCNCTKLLGLDQVTWARTLQTTNDSRIHVRCRRCTDQSPFLRLNGFHKSLANVGPAVGVVSLWATGNTQPPEGFAVPFGGPQRATFGRRDGGQHQGSSRSRLVRKFRFALALIQRYRLFTVGSTLLRMLSVAGGWFRFALLNSMPWERAEPE